MANSNNNLTTIQWGGVNTLVANTTGRVTSDAVAINADDMRGALRCYALNASTPQSGDWVDLWVAWDCTGGAYDSVEHAQYLGRLNTFPTDDPGENPPAKSFPLEVSGFRNFKLVARANQGGSRSISLDCYYNAHRMS